MKFSIRDLLLVTVIVALTVAWWVERSRSRALLLHERLEFIEHFRQLQQRTETDIQQKMAERMEEWKTYLELRDSRNLSTPAPNPPKDKE